MSKNKPEPTTDHGHCFYCCKCEPCAKEEVEIVQKAKQEFADHPTNVVELVPAPEGDVPIYQGIYDEYDQETTKNVS